MYNLIGDMMPVDSSASADSINEELFKDLPSATDISMDPAAAYEAITGSEKPDATEVECMTELFRKQMKLCADACNNGFKYVESPLVRAIRNGWVCELQEPSLITRPAVMPGLNGLLDETGCVVLPTGEMLHRHPDCIIISTLNIDLEGCRPLNQAFMDRHHIIMDMQCPTDDVIVKRILYVPMVYQNTAKFPTKDTPQSALDDLNISEVVNPDEGTFTYTSTISMDLWNDTFELPQDDTYMMPIEHISRILGWEFWTGDNVLKIVSDELDDTNPDNFVIDTNVREETCYDVGTGEEIACD